MTFRGVTTGPPRSTVAYSREADDRSWKISWILHVANALQMLDVEASTSVAGLPRSGGRKDVVLLDVDDELH
jgi:hypothetical protein